jgi:NAD-dependent dihydropyrimidine dehydrogenase PreA subunit
MDKKFEEWHGIPREKIEWYPKIDEEKCIGCGMCVTSCPRGVFKFDYEKRKAKVVNPMNCMIACITCSNLCPVGAISFTKGETPREKAQKVVKDFEVLSKAKEELEKKREELKA